MYSAFLLSTNSIVQCYVKKIILLFSIEYQIHGLWCGKIGYFCYSLRPACCSGDYMSSLFKNLRIHQIWALNKNVRKTVLTAVFVSVSTARNHPTFFLKSVSTNLPRMPMILRALEWLFSYLKVVIRLDISSAKQSRILFTHVSSPILSLHQRTSDDLTSHHRTMQATRHGFRQTKLLSAQLPIAWKNTLSRTMNIHMPIWKQLEDEKCGRYPSSRGSDVSALHL